MKTSKSFKIPSSLAVVRIFWEILSYVVSIMVSCISGNDPPSNRKVNMREGLSIDFYSTLTKKCTGIPDCLQCEQKVTGRLVTYYQFMPH